MVDPPRAAPDGFDPVVWALAWSLMYEHRDHGGFCTAGLCRAEYRLFPCETLRLAQEGLSAAGRVRWTG